MRSQRWYKQILGDVTFKHHFTVTDSDVGSGAGGGIGGSLCGDGVAAMVQGFPPTTIYDLVQFPVRGDVLLARGPEDVYYRRTVVPTDKQAGSFVSPPGAAGEQEDFRHFFSHGFRGTPRPKNLAFGPGFSPPFRKCCM
jgi:hypothetical protein